MIESDVVPLLDEEGPPDSQRQEDSQTNDVFLALDTEKGLVQRSGPRLSILGGRTIKVTDRKSMALVDTGEEPTNLFVQNVNELQPQNLT